MERTKKMIKKLYILPYSLIIASPALFIWGLNDVAIKIGTTGIYLLLVLFILKKCLNIR